MKHLYIASDTPDGGVYHYTEKNGKLQYQQTYHCPRPAYLAVSADHWLYVLLREPLQDQSGVVSYAIQEDGSLIPCGELVPTRGVIGAHIISWQENVYVANYMTGTTIRLPEKMLVHTEPVSGIHGNPSRQECSHPHCLTPTPDGRYLVITDLGCDVLHIVTPELEKVGTVRFPYGAGPRHTIFSQNGKYAYTANELASTVSLLAYENGQCQYLTDTPTIPASFTGENYPSAIRVGADGKIYVSNRGHDSICILRQEGERLIVEDYIPTGGSFPRDFLLTEERMYVANEHSDCVVVYQMKPTPVLCEKIAIPRPLCVIAL